MGQLGDPVGFIINGVEPIIPGEAGLADLRMIEAIYSSMREGQRVRMAV